MKTILILMFLIIGCEQYQEDTYKKCDGEKIMEWADGEWVEFVDCFTYVHELTGNSCERFCCDDNDGYATCIAYGHCDTREW